jgi:hypothetical protein
MLAPMWEKLLFGSGAIRTRIDFTLARVHRARAIAILPLQYSSVAPAETALLSICRLTLLAIGRTTGWVGYGYRTIPKPALDSPTGSL